MSRSRYFVLSIGLAVTFLYLWRPAPVRSQAPQPSSAAQNQGSFQLNPLAGDWVIVRVSVRDAEGRPVNGLGKADFKIFDCGKEQTISQFEEEKGSPEAASPPSLATPRPASRELPPRRFLLLYFDDLHMSASDVLEARKTSGRYLAANLQPGERVALFTSSAMLSDFTADLQQLESALLRLHSYPAATHQPEDSPDSRAWNSLQGLKQVVNIVSLARGWRNIILFSPGFPTRNHRYYLDRIIDSALYSRVVISSLDPRQLAASVTDIPDGDTPSDSSGTVGCQDTIDPTRKAADGNVLAKIAEGTGGEFLRDNNNLTTAFRGLAGSQGSYLLAFNPTDAKRGGKLHSLKIALTEKHEGFTVRARDGYFAGRPPGEPPRLETRPMTSPMLEAEARERARIREAVASSTDRHELPVELETQVTKTPSGHELAVLAHLDAKALRFQKNGTRNRTTVTFVSVVYDRDGSYVTGQEQRAVVDLPDRALPGLLAEGVNSRIVFQLPPGSYTIREVVTESEEHHVTAFSRKVEVQ